MSALAAAPPQRLPTRTAYYLRHLLRGRYRLRPAPVSPPGPPPTRRLQFTREQLRLVPESPEFQATLATATGTQYRGWIWTGEDRRPVLVLNGLGAWILTLPRYGRNFDALRELQQPADLTPIRFTAWQRNGRTHHRHTIPLRWHPHATLSLEVVTSRTGQVAYDTWVWLPGRRLMVPVSWAEAQRVIGLFRDLTASYFRPAPPPITPAPAEEHRDDGTPTGS